MGERSTRVCVLGVTSLLTVTVEEAPDGDPEVHVHAGGQGLWVARMAAVLGADVVVCSPFGGEIGPALLTLAEREGYRVRATPYDGTNGAYVHDRRRGERDEVAHMDPTLVGRHDLDDLFGAVLVESLDADVVVLTGAEPARTVPDDFFARLARDLRAAGRRVVADLSGRAAACAVDEGLDVLKMSHSEMVDGGFADGDALDELVAGARGLIERGAGAVVVSRAAEPTLVVEPDDAALVVTPPVTPVEHRGAGDSMTASLAVGVARGTSLVDAARLGAAAGALNVTRHGLGSGRREQIERYVVEVEVTDLDGDRREGS
ncbi:PfkB family carbohydrate kinase [Cellulomonas carbonis]|uniref:PfkB family carbohydrate kinase n=1 Tax=Cellulomonas carbonis TaxID=1386092 RepID=UPI0012699498|nr:PfkB family carbohydrate kinase [Cellulomonas carbonis]